MEETEKYRAKLLEMQYDKVYDRLTFVDQAMQSSIKGYIRTLVEAHYSLQLDDNLRLVLRDKQNPHFKVFDNDLRELTLQKYLWKELKPYLKKT